MNELVGWLVAIASGAPTKGYNVQKKAAPLFIYDDDGLYLTFKDSGLEF
jgi:hypothetical protein